MAFNFEKLDVYMDAVDYANRVYEISKDFPKDEIFGITNQIRRASVSIPANIAEGSSRGKKEFIHFLNIALGSAYECVPLLQISKNQKYINNENINELVQTLHKISAKISALKNSLKK
jgi:four helix bundle protein